MSFFNSPVGKRTRLQWQLYAQGSKDSCRSTRRKHDEANKVNKSMVDELEVIIKHDENESFHGSMEENDVVKEINDIKSTKFAVKNESCRSENSSKVGTHTYPICLSDDSDSDFKYVLEEQEEPRGPSISNKLDDSSLYECKDEESDSEESTHRSMEESDWARKINDVESTKMKNEGYPSANSMKSGTHTYPIYLSDDSDSSSDASSDASSESDETFVPEEQEESSHRSTEESDRVKEINDIKSTKLKINNEGHGSASSFKIGFHKYPIYLSDDSDSDDTSVFEEQQEADEDLQISCKYHQQRASSREADSFQSTADDAISSSESESDYLDDSAFSLLKNRPHQPTTQKQSETNMNMDQKAMDELSDIDAYEKINAEDKVEGSDTEESYISSKESVDVKKTDNVEFTDTSLESEGYDSANSSKIGLDTYSCYSSDDSDSDDTVEEHENQNQNQNQIDIEAGSFQSTEDEPSSSSESESDDLDDIIFTLSKKKKSYEPRTNKKASLNNSKERNRVERKEKNHSMHKTNMKKLDKRLMNKASDIDADEKTNAKAKVKDHYKKDKANGVRYQEFKKGGKKNNVGFVDAILDSIIRKVDTHGEKRDSRIPLEFRFDDSDESLIKEEDEPNGEELFEEMEFVLECGEIGSYRTPTAENREKDDNVDSVELCRRGEHGDIYFEEQIGMRCRLCGAVLLESRYVISKLANYAPDKSKRSDRFDEHMSSFGNVCFDNSDWNPVDICKQTKGTVWQLVPINIQGHLYPHQLEGFQFLWENLAGTIELSRLQKLGSGGGCIISHAPGTGKTLLTIVFIETFIKKFPRCYPVIVAPASMLLTWEAEFKKWHVGISFINLNNSESLKNEMIDGCSGRSRDLIRAMKIRSWCNGGSVLGVSYNLYTKLAGNSNTRNLNLEKMGDVLLDMPGLVVLDEGHTPRNKNSNIWNTLVKLKTKNRVILSGTPFQNNFKELFNTLRLVRPETATKIVNEKTFADMIQQRKKKNCGDRSSTSEDIEKLKVIISPFVHIHKGHILESKLPGLKQSIILLNPHPSQKCLIDYLGSLARKDFEYEHKVALVSVHPALILRCSLTKDEEKLINKEELGKVRLNPDAGVKTRFVMELIRLGVSLHEKVLIFSQYIQPLELLKDQTALAFGWDVGREIMLIKGGINHKHRQAIINDFNNPKSDVKVLLASIRCCSEGIHLYGASRVVLLDVVWNPSVERQAISRAYRLGQKKVVYTYHLMAAGTTEEEKYDRQVEKGRLAELVFSSSIKAGGESRKKVNVDDKILQQMVDHQELKDMFNKIRYPENRRS